MKVTKQPDGLQRKIDRSIKLLQSVAPTDGSAIEIAYSGGKDSDVIAPAN